MNPYSNTDEDKANEKGRVIDLVFPISVLIISCVLGLIYTGCALDGANVIEAFSNSDASVGLMLGGALALIVTIIYYMCRRLISFKDCM